MYAASISHQKWAGDISYICTTEIRLCRAVVIDLFGWQVIGRAVSARMKKDLAIKPLEMAIPLHNPPEGCIFRSDRGSQHCSYDLQKKLQANGLVLSMSGNANWYDNASVETFFSNSSPLAFEIKVA